MFSEIYLTAIIEQQTNQPTNYLNLYSSFDTHYLHPLYLIYSHSFLLIFAWFSISFPLNATCFSSIPVPLFSNLQHTHTHGHLPTHHHHEHPSCWSGFVAPSPGWRTVCLRTPCRPCSRSWRTSEIIAASTSHPKCRRSASWKSTLTPCRPS